jgi:hypothetical protein
MMIGIQFFVGLSEGDLDGFLLAPSFDDSGATIGVVGMILPPIVLCTC